MNKYLDRIQPLLTVLFGIGLLAASMLQTAHAQQAGMQTISGKVVDVIVSGNFTYVEIGHASSTVWAAGIGSSAIKKGDRVSFSAQMPMQNFFSKNLNRTFPVIYFVKQFDVGGSEVPAEQLLEQINSNKSVAPAVSRLFLQNSEIPVGSLLREATMDGLDGNSRKLSEYKGKPLLINVWASWCGPCRAEMGSLQRLATKFNGKEFNIIGISTDDYRDDALQAIKMSKIEFENFIDHKLVLEKMLGAKTIPLTILVDAEGRILKKVNGAREWDSAEMISDIKQEFKLN